MPVRPWVQFVRGRKGYVAFPTEYRPDPFSASIIAYHRLGRLPALTNLLRVCRSNTKVAEAMFTNQRGDLIPASAQRERVRSTAMLFLQAYFWRSPSLDMNELAFDAVFTQLADEISSRSYSVSLVMPLFGLKLTFQRAIVGPGMVLRRTSRSEIERWLNGNPFADGISLDWDLAHELTSTLETTYQQPLHASSLTKQFANSAQTMLTLIRLLTGQGISAAFIDERSRSMLTTFRTSYRFDVRVPSELTVFTTQMARDLAVLWADLEASVNRHRLDVALRRWDQAATRIRAEDKIIDFWIGLESLFTPDSNGELRFRSALRIATLLGTNQDDRVRIYEEILKSYVVRSRIVHGNQQAGQSVDEVAESTGRHLRDAILHIARSKEPFVPTGIETALLRGL